MADTHEEDLSFGNQAVGRKFNPGGTSNVDRIKELMAEVIDIVEANRKDRSSELVAGDKSRLTQLIDDNAVQELVNAQMAAVKAVTWEQPEK